MLAALFGLTTNLLLIQIFPNVLLLPIIGTLLMLSATVSCLHYVKTKRGYTTYAAFLSKGWDVSVLMLALNILAFKQLIPAPNYIGTVCVLAILGVLFIGTKFKKVY